MKIIVQDIATEYQDEGHGRIILFLHGWNDNLHTFDSLTPLLTPAWRIIRLDLPGFGQSEAPRETWNLDNYVKFVSCFIEKLNIQIYVLTGHSFGGRIAIEGAATKQFHPQKIILIGSAGIAENRIFRNSILKFFTKIGGLISYIPPLIFWREKLRKKIYKLIGSDYLNAGALKETFLKIISKDLSASAKKIATPALLVWGQNDTETPLIDGKKLSQLISGSELKVINGAGHFVHKERSQEVAKLILEFI